MKEKPKGLDVFKGMNWKRARRELDMNAHMLILGDKEDPRALRVVQSYRDFGIDVGMATLAVVLFLRQYGAPTAACEAVSIYRGIIKEIREKPDLKKDAATRLDNFEFQLGQMENWIYYSRPSSGKREWSLKPEFKTVNERGGLANIMLYLSMLELVEDGSTTGLIAAQGIQRFMERDKEHKKAG